MQTYGHLWQYFTEFFLEWEMLQTKVVKKNQNTHNVFNKYFQKLCHSWDNVEKHGIRS
jgi:hypothetical protein